MAAGDVAVVGDRLLTDIAMARSLGMTGVLVLTGATAADAVASAPVQPHFVIDSLDELLAESPADMRAS
jgi:NagD protein